MTKYILGISAFYHDSAAALIRDGEVIAAAQEERFTRIKYDSRFPRRAVEYCLKEAKIGINDISFVVFYDKPWLKFERIIETYLAFAPKGILSFTKAMPIWLKQKLFMKKSIKKELDFKGEILFSSHHESHAASAFYPSPFNKAAILTIDGVGEWATVTSGIGEGNQISFLEEIYFPHSLGLLYSAFTYYTGFRVNSGEYKLMGLAPYGEAKYVDDILNNLIDLKSDGSFKLNVKYFGYCTGLIMTNNSFHKLFGGPPRKPEEKIEKRHMDIAKSIQTVTEIIILKIIDHLYKKAGCNNLCLAGGVALNCVANGKILRQGPFKNIWIQPAASDAGGALGAALAVWFHFLDNERSADEINDSQSSSLLGPSFTDDEIESILLENNAIYEKMPDDLMYEKIGDLLADEKVIGWFQGRMEFGPRALGSRSILGDPRSEIMQSVMNLKIKFRESFRPFAPSVIKEKVFDYFNLDCESPYMLLVAEVNDNIKNPIDNRDSHLIGMDKLKIKRSSIPAVTHVDYSARVQTVSSKSNPTFYKLLQSFYKKTRCPVLINTSFNVRGEPIVCSPQDAYRCLLRTHMDYLAIGHFLLDRAKQKQDSIKIGDLSEFHPD
jgi:carbamoyltransferase